MNTQIGSIDGSGSVFLNMFIATIGVQSRPLLSHSHNFAEIAVVMSGSGTYTIAGQEYPIYPGNMFSFGHNTIHYITNITSPLELLTLQFPSSLLVGTTSFRTGFPDWRLFTTPVALYVAGADAEPLRRIMYDIRKNLTEQPIAYSTYVHSLVIQLAISLLRVAADRKIELTPAKNNAAILAAISYIDNNITQHITLRDVAAAAMLSPSYFSYSFKQYTGYSMIDYVNAKRIKLARKMFISKPELSISDVAMRVGFNNMSNFNRTFRKHADCTPSEYIANNGAPGK